MKCQAGRVPASGGHDGSSGLTSSGGFTQFAKIKGIYILRTEDGKQVKHEFNYKDVVKGKKPELNILVQPGDVIVVP